MTAQDGSAIEHWLTLLREGDEQEQQLARTELGLILESRGLLDEAYEAYERNVQEGVSDRRPYERLAALARARNDVATEARALRLLASLLDPPAPAPPEVEPDGTDGKSAPNTQAPEEPPTPSAAEVDPEPPATLKPPALEGDDVVEQARRADGRRRSGDVVPREHSASGAHRRDGEVGEYPSEPPVASHAFAIPPSSLGDDTDGHAPAAQLPGSESVAATARTTRLALADMQSAARPRATEADEADEAQDRESQAALPRQAALGRGTLLAGIAALLLLALGGGALLLRTLRESSPEEVSIVGVSASEPEPTPTLILVVEPSPAVAAENRAVAERAGDPSPSPPAQALPSPSPTPLPVRCTDAALRFPETKDTTEAVRTAFREYMARQGVTVDPSSREFVGLGQAYLTRPDDIVAGWMGVTLQRERRGLPVFSLADYVSSDVIMAIGPNEYQLRGTISPQGWNEIQSWPVDTCEGAFIKNPANAHWVEAMQSSVGDITWALPTPTPR